MIRTVLDRPWLALHLPRPMRVLSWAPYGAGWRDSALILWREVRNTDLAEGFDAESWLAGELPDPGAVAMLTSRDVSSFVTGRAEVEGIGVDCVATVGLSNAEAVGRRLPWHPADGSAGASTDGGAGGYGTINIAVVIDAALTEAAQLEALSIAVEARTAAVMGAGWQLETGIATGTGTDCLALACDAAGSAAGQGGALRYAGLHTAVGEAVGAAVRDTVGRAVTDWCAWRSGSGSARPPAR